MDIHTPNISADEIQKFGNHATQWWDDRGPLKTLHQINPVRVDWIASQAQLKQQKVLDIGCGGGILSEAIAKLEAQVTGIDMAAESIMVAKMHAQESELDIDYQVTTAESWSEHHFECYDYIVCMEMLEHVPSPSSIIEAAFHMLKPGGILFLSTINKHPKAKLLGILAAEYVLGWVPKGTHDFQKFIKPSELVAMTRPFSEPLLVQGITFQPWLGSRHPFGLSKDTDVNYMASFRKTDPSNLISPA